MSRCEGLLSCDGTGSCYPPWAGVKQLGTPSEDAAYGVATDMTGNVFAAGYTFGGLDSSANAGGADLFVAKYNFAGLKQWTRQLGMASDDYAQSLATDANGKVYAAGYTLSGLDGATNAGGEDLFVVKYDSAGAKQWTRQLGTAASDRAWGVATDVSGNVYVAGSTRGGLDGNATAGFFDLFVVKYNSAGDKQWTQQLGSPSNDLVLGVATDASGSVYAAGGTRGSLDGNTNAGFDDMFVVKYDPAGVKQWTRQLGGADWDTAYGLATDASGSVYVTGYTSTGLDGNLSAGGNDLFVVKYTSAGVKQWTRQLGTASADYAYGVATDISGNVYMTGHTRGGLDGNINAGLQDLFVAKYNSDGALQ